MLNPMNACTWVLAMVVAAIAMTVDAGEFEPTLAQPTVAAVMEVQPQSQPVYGVNCPDGNCATLSQPAFVANSTLCPDGGCVQAPFGQVRAVYTQPPRIRQSVRQVYRPSPPRVQPPAVQRRTRGGFFRRLFR